MMKQILLLAAAISGFLNGLQAQRVKAEIKKEAGVPALYLNGVAVPPYAYMSYLGETKYYREAAAAGIHLYNIPAYLGDRGINASSGIKPFRPAIWKGTGEYDLESVEKEMATLLQADPAANIILRIHLDPPVWWENLHPGEVCRQPDGSGLRTSFSSQKWRQDAGKALKAVVEKLLASPYGHRLIGIHVAGASTEEWLYHIKTFFYDESDARKNAFRNWLRVRYGNSEAALKKAWGDESVTFDNALAADISGAEKKQEWSTDPRFVNTFEFHSETMADNIAFFCRIVKETSRGSLLTGAFYGYHLFVNDARRGHSALFKLLQCRELDYLSSPNDYKRVAGEDWMPMVAIRSVQLHGKLWLAENDTRTFKTTLLRDRAPGVEPPGDWYSRGVWIGPADPALSVSLLKKNLARMLTYGYGGWWFDMWGGWFSDPRLMAVLQLGQQLHAQYPREEEPRMRPEVAVITDERLQNRDGSFGSLTAKINGNRYALGKTGAPYDLFLRGDSDSVGAAYKIVWLLGVTDLSGREKEHLKEWAANGITVLHTDGHKTTLYPARGGAPQLFEGKVQWEAAELGALWQKAGVHRYIDNTGDVIYAGRGWFSIHSLAAGKKTIRLPAKATVTEPGTGKVIARHVKVFSTGITAGETRLFRIDFTR